MKTIKILSIILALATLSMTVSCRRTGDDIWEDSKTAGRHVSRGFRTLGGKHGDSRQVYCRDDFYPYQDNCMQPPALANDFTPLYDQNSSDEIAMADSYVRQPRECPGDPGSSVPGLDSFRDPHTVPGLANIFQNIHFEYNSDLVKGRDSMDTIHRVADYMRKHPATYLFVEGHCDQRGPEAYNLALGSRRSNAVRNALIADGVNPDAIFTISYGKERPLVMENHEEAWAQNRRAEFKVYQR